jgi:hypothetical protein
MFIRDWNYTNTAEDFINNKIDESTYEKFIKLILNVNIFTGFFKNIKTGIYEKIIKVNNFYIFTYVLGIFFIFTIILLFTTFKQKKKESIIDINYAAIEDDDVT